MQTAEREVGLYRFARVAVAQSLPTCFNSQANRSATSASVSLGLGSLFHALYMPVQRARHMLEATCWRNEKASTYAVTTAREI